MWHFARTRGAGVYGADASLLDVEVHVADPEDPGESFFRIVGLPDAAVREGRQRIRGAVAQGGWTWPDRVLVNLAPAGARKEGAALDLPIAVAALTAHGVIARDGRLHEALFLGELGLDGTLRGVRGVLAAVETARAAGIRRAFVPRANVVEAAAVDGIEVRAVGHLREAIGHLSGERPLPPEPLAAWSPDPWALDGVSEVRGQDLALRAALAAAVGGHNLLLSGPPGAGKTLLARHVADLLPPLTYEEALEVSRVHSVAGLLPHGLVRRRPFRAPHHTTSLPGLIGGGPIPRPGEISLAHLGVLFLDELPEFPRDHLEALRQPLEDGHLFVSRAAGSCRFPSDIVLVAAMNPCPCGWRGVEGRCRCTPQAYRRYAARVSGPLKDRFDLLVDVKPVEARALVDAPPPSPIPLEQVVAARARQAERARCLDERRASGLRFANSRIPGRLLPAAVAPTPQASEALVVSAERLGLTGRGIHRCLRVARTFADLDGSDKVEPKHVRLAVSFRPDAQAESRATAP